MIGKRIVNERIPDERIKEISFSDAPDIPYVIARAQYNIPLIYGPWSPGGFGQCEGYGRLEYYEAG